MADPLVNASLIVEVGDFHKFVTTAANGLSAISDMRKVVTQYAYKLQATAVRNVSGVEVTYSGGTFVINRQTGKLARSIQVLPDFGGGLLSSLVVASANYAAAVEYGSPERDLKPLLMGKTIPIPVKGTTKEKKQAVADGLATAREKVASTGRTNRTEYIAYRKVGPKSKGWIIPAQKGRPFMQAASEEIAPAFQAAVAETFAKYLNAP